MAEHFLEAGYHVIFFHREGSTLPFVRRLAWLLAQREALIASHKGAAAAPSVSSSSLNSFALLRALQEERPRNDSVKDSFQFALQFADVSGSPLPHTRAVLESVRRFKQPEQQARFLPLEFSSVADYLFGLRELCTSMRDHFATGPSGAATSSAPTAAAVSSASSQSAPSPALQRRCLLLLAAAVSDYHIPAADMALHKLESRAGPLRIDMQQTPKTLHALRHGLAAEASSSNATAAEDAWFPSGFAVSFKLETDSSVLLRKATAALRSYRVNAVVANMLHTRYQQVQLVTTRTGEDNAEPAVQSIVRGHGSGSGGLPSEHTQTAEKQKPGQIMATAPLEFEVEVEVPLVAALIAAHEAWMQQA